MLTKFNSISFKSIYSVRQVYAILNYAKGMSWNTTKIKGKAHKAHMGQQVLLAQWDGIYND